MQTADFGSLSDRSETIFIRGKSRYRGSHQCPTDTLQIESPAAAPMPQLPARTIKIFEVIFVLQVTALQRKR